MQKLEDWLNIIPLTGMIGAAFLTGTIYGRGLANISWETVVAGFLGLLGGAFAWLATKKQINHQIQETDEKKRTFATRFLQELKAQMAMISAVTSMMMNDKFCVNKVAAEIRLEILNAHTIPEIPAEIEDAIAEAAINLRQKLYVTIVSLTQDCAMGRFDQGPAYLAATDQKTIKEIFDQSNELIKAVESKLNS